MTTELLMVTMLQSVLSVFNDLQRTFIQIKKLQVPRNRQGLDHEKLCSHWPP